MREDAFLDQAAIDAGPTTHILVVGVGDYHFMRGPDGKALNPKGVTFYPEVLELERLTSPQKSAPEVASWFFDNRQALHRPLGSMQVLLGDGGLALAGNPAPTVNPDKANLQEAAKAWYDRLDTHEDNVGVFYFCGHGITYSQTDEQLLLLQDFGDETGELWERSVNFEQFYRAMKSCKAKTQLFLIDACRDKGPDWNALGKDKATRLITLKPPQPGGKSAPIVQSTTSSAFALGKKDDVSFFTTDLIAVFNRYGARQRGNQWIATTRSIHGALPDVANLKNPRDGAAVTPSGEVVQDLPIFRVPKPGSLAKVVTEPSGMTKNSLVMCQCGQAEPAKYGPGKEPLVFDLELGEYTLNLKGPDAKGAPLTIGAVLPITEVVLT